MTTHDILEDQLVENCVREDLKPVEQAKAFKALVDARGYSYRQLAEVLNISHMAVSRAMSLLELPQDLQEQVTAGNLAASVASEVAKLEDHDDQREVAARVVAEGLNRSEAIEAIRQVASKLRVGGSKSRNAIKTRPKRPTVKAIRTNDGQSDRRVQEGRRLGRGPDRDGGGDRQDPVRAGERPGRGVIDAPLACTGPPSRARDTNDPPPPKPTLQTSGVTGRRLRVEPTRSRRIQTAGGGFADL